MSDDLVERLRDNTTRYYDDKMTDRLEAADRIEELEAQLEKIALNFPKLDAGLTDFGERESYLLAEWKGETDE